MTYHVIATRHFALAVFAIVTLGLTGLSQAATVSISGTPQTWIAPGNTYKFQPTVTGGSKNKKFTIVNRPGWASFSSSTGLLTGTPTVANVGTYYNIVIKVTSAGVTQSLPAFTITVQAPNTAPKISGAPTLSTFVGAAYSFKPTASDAEGNALTFSIANKPAWASFNTSTGLLSGTPTAAATHANITIGVSDGKVTAALAPFTLQVLPVVTGSVTLSWTAPTENVDGTPLTDLAGFRVHYGTSPTALTQIIHLPGTSMTRVEVTELPSGTYYFAVKAYNASNMESDLSGVVYKTIM